MRVNRKTLAYRCAAVVLIGLFGPAAWADRAVVDMAGRKVVVASPVERSATVGAGPILDSFLAALGVGATLVNGMPVSARLRQPDCCRFLPRVIPGVLELPSVESASFQIDRELLLRLRPDVVLMHGEHLAQEIDAAGLRSFVVHLTAGRDANAAQVMTRLGELYGREETAQAYARHFTGLLDRVGQRLAGIDERARQRAIYFNFPALSLTSTTADWWIDAAGGRSVTRALPLKKGRADLSIEQLLAWNPQVIFAATPGERRAILADARLSGLAAVRDGRIYPVPRSVIRWAHPSPEQAVGVLWAAATLYPAHFSAAEVETEVERFYRTFYRVSLSSREIRDILHPTDAEAPP